MEYPEDAGMPDDWDRIKYLYVINPETFYQDPFSVQINEDLDEMTSGDINPEFVVSALSFRVASSWLGNPTLREIFRNETVDQLSSHSVKRSRAAADQA